MKFPFNQSPAIRHWVCKIVHYMDEEGKRFHSPKTCSLCNQMFLDWRNGGKPCYVKPDEIGNYFCVSNGKQLPREYLGDVFVLS